MSLDQVAHVDEGHQIADQNRRQNDRVVCKVDITLESESTFYNGFTENLSTGGVFVATYDTRPIGGRMKLEFTIPGNDKPIEVEGEIRWLREYNETTPDMIPGMGVRFLNLKDEDLETLTEFISYKEPLFYDDDL